jgi:HAD superfamily hydrolase (TIGR01509 family)
MSGICVIFDLDGTLVDSEGLCNQAFLDLLPQLNDTQRTLTERYRGQKLAPILADLENRLRLKLPDTFEQDYRQRVAELFASDLQPMPGVLEMLEAITFPKCIASGGPLSKIHHALKISGLAPYFEDNIFSSYEVGCWKPQPGLFQFAARAMGFIPAQCAVIEDSDIGIAAATAAEMKAYRYQGNGNASSYRTEQEIQFQDMLQLPQLLADFASLISTPDRTFPRHPSKKADC